MLEPAEHEAQDAITGGALAALVLAVILAALALAAGPFVAALALNA